jgi:2'-hydroxyisoflavone reductase
MIDRREWVQGALATALLAGGPLGAVERARRPLDLLFLGGTGFLGRHQVEYALARGHRVTLFNRGRSASAPYNGRAEVLLGDRDARVGDGLASLAGSRRWDAVIDNSGYVPRHVRDSIKMLRGRVGRCLFVSTVAVYDPQGGPTLDESAPLHAAPEPFTEEVSGRTYGPLKAECERVARSLLGEQLTVVRPTFVFGPGDDTDRFTYWVERVARGGEVLAPSEPEQLLTWIDARDLCPWTVELVERDVAGTFNASGPSTPTTWRSVLTEIAALATGPVRFNWATAEVLRAQRINLPLFASGRPPRQFSTDAALRSGLRHRPLLDTAKATLDWWRAQTPERRAQVEGWPTAEQERAALAALDRSPA